MRCLSFRLPFPIMLTCIILAPGQAMAAGGLLNRIENAVQNVTSTVRTVVQSVTSAVTQNVSAIGSTVSNARSAGPSAIQTANGTFPLVNVPERIVPNLMTALESHAEAASSSPQNSGPTPTPPPFLQNLSSTLRSELESRAKQLASDPGGLLKRLSQNGELPGSSGQSAKLQSLLAHLEKAHSDIQLLIPPRKKAEIEIKEQQIKSDLDAIAANDLAKTRNVFIASFHEIEGILGNPVEEIDTCVTSLREGSLCAPLDTAINNAILELAADPTIQSGGQAAPEALLEQLRMMTGDDLAAAVKRANSARDQIDSVLKGIEPQLRGIAKDSLQQVEQVFVLNFPHLTRALTDLVKFQDLFGDPLGKKVDAAEARARSQVMDAAQQIADNLDAGIERLKEMFPGVQQAEQSLADCILALQQGESCVESLIASGGSFLPPLPWEPNQASEPTTPEATPTPVPTPAPDSGT